MTTTAVTKPVLTIAAPVGIVFVSALDIPDTKFPEGKPAYRIKLFIEPDVARVLYAQCRDVFRATYPDLAASSVHLPLARRQDGSIIATAESTRRPNITGWFSDGIRPVAKWDEVRVTGSLSAYRRQDRCGVNFRLYGVERLVNREVDVCRAERVALKRRAVAVL